MKKSDMNFINLYWDNNNCNEYFYTNAPLTIIEEIIKDVQKIEYSNTDDVYEILRDIGFEVEGISFEEIEF